MFSASNEQNWVDEPSLNTSRSMANAFCAFTHRNVALTQLQNALFLSFGKPAAKKTLRTTARGKSIPMSRASGGAEGCRLQTRTCAARYTLRPVLLLQRELRTENWVELAEANCRREIPPN